MTMENGPHEAQPSSADLVRSQPCRLPELWHEILERLREVQESQAKLADAIEVLGMMVQDALGADDPAVLGDHAFGAAPSSDPEGPFSTDLLHAPDGEVPSLRRLCRNPSRPPDPQPAADGGSPSRIQGRGRSCRQFHHERRGPGAVGMERSSRGARTSCRDRRTRTGLLRPFLRRGSASCDVGRGAHSERSRRHAGIRVRPRERGGADHRSPGRCGHRRHAGASLTDAPRRHTPAPRAHLRTCGG